MQPWQLLALVAIILVIRLALTFVPVRTGEDASRRAHISREYLDPFIVAGLAAWVLITFVVRTYYIPSESMVPTLLVHDVLLVNKFEYRFHEPHRGDVVVFPPPIVEPGSDDDFIKRTIGTPGDTLKIQGGTVYINGQPLVEPYIAERPNYNLEIKNYGVYSDQNHPGQMIALDPKEANIPPKSMWTAPDRIPPHCYFMMGDNRNDSDDSHMWGFAQNAGSFASGQKAGRPAGFTGHAFFIFWPINRAHGI
ncbi:MAG: signal peptidase I [Candidatus Eremiobacteraeota bacterium]|nr:signal peptidase I [Candidatus Eremiobacteraeota bacterium]